MRLPPLLHRRHLLLASTAAIALAACGKRQPQAQALPAEATVLALGDSLTQGVGAKADEAWPSLLAERTGWDVINAGIWAIPAPRRWNACPICCRSTPLPWWWSALAATIFCAR